MKIVKATIMEFKEMPDMVYLLTDLPSPTPNILPGNFTFVIECEKGKSKEYLEKHFEFTEDVKNNIQYIDGD